MKISPIVETCFLTSKEAKEYLKINDCDLSHIRLSGNVKFVKKGNSYLYCKNSLSQLKKCLK